MKIDPLCNLMVSMDGKDARIFQQVLMSKEEVADLVLACIAKWTSTRANYDSIRVGGILHNRKASLCDGS